MSEAASLGELLRLAKKIKIEWPPWITFIRLVENNSAARSKTLDPIIT